MSFASVIGFIIYLIVIAFILAFALIFTIQVIDMFHHYSPAQRREREAQSHAAILQAATRRKLSTRRPVSPYRYRQCKPTKSAAKNNYNSD